MIKASIIPKNTHTANHDIRVFTDSTVLALSTKLFERCPTESPKRIQKDLMNDSTVVSLKG